MRSAKVNAEVLSFSGLAGQRRLIEALRAQRLVSGDEVLARQLAAAGRVCRYERGEVLITQDEEDNDLYMLLSGEVSIRVNQRQVAVRTSGTHVGEMALVDALATRSATVAARGRVAALRISERDFSDLAQNRPELWRHIAAEVAARLRERNAAIRVPNTQPLLFIGSSSEGLPVGREVEATLSREAVVTRLWTDGVFQASSTSIESLIGASRDADFAALILTPDDVVTSRGKRKAAPRDNVLFELGLFMGALGRERVFIVKPTKLDIRVPSDLLGVTCVEYLRGGPQPRSVRLAPVRRRLLADIQRLGPR